MGMNQLLDEFYGTSKTAAAAPRPTEVETEKAAEAAQVQLFLKLAASEGIDVDGTMKTAEGKAYIDQLWGNFQKHAAAQAELDAKNGKVETTKTAGEEEKEVKARQLLEEAEKEHKEKKAAAVKIAEADFCGRVMAHSMTQELHLIRSGGEVSKEAQALALKKVAEFPPKKDDDKKDEKKDDKGGDDKGPPKDKGDDKGGDDKKPPFMFGKKASSTPAIDALAAEHAVQKIAAFAKEKGGNDEQIKAAAEECAQKLAAADVLGMFKESTKIAMTQDKDVAIDWRACELLETVGYPITWPEA